MNALRISVLTAVVATLSATFACGAAPASDAASASCTPATGSLVERRIAEEAGRGMPALISFVNRTQGIYRLRVVDAVAWVDSERERRTACMHASAGDLSD